MLEASEATAEHFASLKGHLRETGSLLVSYDAHFRSIPGLRIWTG